MNWYTIRMDHIEDFKRSHPSHNLPADLESLHFQFDSRGDLVDIESYINIDGETKQIAPSSFDGPALRTLAQDSKRYGDIS